MQPAMPAAAPAIEPGSIEPGAIETLEVLSYTDPGPTGWHQMQLRNTALDASLMLPQ